MPKKFLSQEETTEYFRSEDGIKICYKKFPSVIEPKGILIIIQGGGGGKADDYRSFAKILNSDGYSVIRVDERGTGDSEGVRGDIKDYNIVIKDYICLIKKVRMENTDKKIFVLGHSFGGVVVTRLAFEVKKELSGIVLLNPMFGYAKEYGPSLHDIIFFIYCMIFQPSKPVYNIAGDLNRINYPLDKEEALSNDNDSRIVKKFSVRYLMTTKKIIDLSAYYSKHNSIPLLLARGKRDEFIDKEKTAEIFDIWPCDNKHEIIIENAGHGTYIANLVAVEIIKWLNSF